MGFTTFLNIFFIVPNTIINPISAALTNPYRAIGIGSFVFFINSLQRAYLFRKEIFTDSKNKSLLKKMIPFSILGAFIGSLFISRLNTTLLSVVIIVTSLYFIYSTILILLVDNKNKNEGRIILGPIPVSILTGLIQGVALPGADIRAGYLRTKVSEVSVRAVSSFIGLFNFLILSTVLFINHKMPTADIWFVISLIPALFLIQHIGKKILVKIPDKYAKILALTMSIVSLGVFIYSMFIK
jgi:uncharacterized membrane protein YfcA